MDSSPPGRYLEHAIYSPGTVSVFGTFKDINGYGTAIFAEDGDICINATVEKITSMTGHGLHASNDIEINHNITDQIWASQNGINAGNDVIIYDDVKLIGSVTGHGINAGNDVWIMTSASVENIRGNGPSGIGINAGNFVIIGGIIGDISEAPPGNSGIYGTLHGIFARSFVTINGSVTNITGTEGNGIWSDIRINITGPGEIGSIIGGTNAIETGDFDDIENGIKIQKDISIIRGGLNGIKSNAEESFSIGIWGNIGEITGLTESGINSSTSVSILGNIETITGAKHGILANDFIYIDAVIDSITGLELDGIHSTDAYVSIDNNTYITEISGERNGIYADEYVVIYGNVGDLDTNTGGIIGNNGDGIWTNGILFLTDGEFELIKGKNGLVSADSKIEIRGSLINQIEGTAGNGIEADHQILITDESDINKIIGSENGIKTNFSVYINSKVGEISGGLDGINAKNHVFITDAISSITGAVNGIKSEERVQIDDTASVTSITGGSGSGIDAVFIDIHGEVGDIEGKTGIKAENDVHIHQDALIGNITGTVGNGIDAENAYISGSIEAIIGNASGISLINGLIISGEIGFIEGKGTNGNGIEAEGYVNITDSGVICFITGSDNGIKAESIFIAGSIYGFWNGNEVICITGKKGHGLYATGGGDNNTIIISETATITLIEGGNTGMKTYGNVVLDGIINFVIGVLYGIEAGDESTNKGRVTINNRVGAIIATDKDHGVGIRTYGNTTDFSGLSAPIAVTGYKSTFDKQPIIPDYFDIFWSTTDVQGASICGTAPAGTPYIFADNHIYIHIIPKDPPSIMGSNQNDTIKTGKSKATTLTTPTSTDATILPVPLTGDTNRFAGYLLSLILSGLFIGGLMVWRRKFAIRL